MKNILVTAATEAEIGPFLQFLQENYRTVTDRIYHSEQWNIQILISGVGMMSTAFALGTAFAKRDYDMALQAGIGGAFDTDISLGSVWAVKSEQFGDLGAEDKGAYIDIFDLGFLDPNTFPFTEGKLLNPSPMFIGPELPLASGISINTVSGQQDTIAVRKERYSAQLESMEGIAFHYACLQAGLPFLQIRAISNYVTPRDRSAWQIKTAIENLNDYLCNTFAL